MKSRKPVPFYDAARYPDLDSHKLERRKSGRGILHRPGCQRDDREPRSGRWYLWRCQRHARGGTDGGDPPASRAL